MEERAATFIIIREDQELDPTILVSEGLQIGRAPGSDLLLNHPTVSRWHAGIKEIEGRFYLFNLNPANSTTLNGRLVALEEAAALASADIVRIGPFSLRMERKDKALEITVRQQIGISIGEAESREELSRSPVSAELVPKPSEITHALDLFWGKRTRSKAARQSPLHPRQPPRLGKIRFNWTPTRDLVRPWPFSIFIWSTIVLGGLSVAAAIWYTTAYSPMALSDVHDRTQLHQNPAIAVQPNAAACTTCHSLKSGMESRCANCHETEIFTATVSTAHKDVAIGCLQCHGEHRGNSFRPMHAALDSCLGCHNDQNIRTYNGKNVHTPHGGTLGYPVVNGEWKWKGLDPKELEKRPELVALHLPADSERQWRSKQFHALHLYRVRATGGISGVKSEGTGEVEVLSCSSCHRSFNPIDRESPKQTCQECHSGLVDESGQTLIAAGAPNCISCHVQHPDDKRHWRPELLVDAVQQSAGEK